VWRWDQGDPFGNDVPNNNPSGGGAFDFPLRFPGQYFDRETNLAYNMARDFDPGIGRFLEADPERFVDGVNLYAFVRSSPLMFADPTGRSVWEWLRKKGMEHGLLGGVGALQGEECAKKACKKNWGQPATDVDATEICARLLQDSSARFQYTPYDVLSTCKDVCKNTKCPCPDAAKKK